MREFKLGDRIVFDVTAGGQVLPGVLKETIGSQAFIHWVKLDGESATILLFAGEQFWIEFDDGYVIKDVSASYFVESQTRDDEQATGEVCEQLSPEECLRLNELLRSELVIMLGDTDIQIGCYELVYVEFFENADFVSEEREKLVSDHLDVQWAEWRKKLIQTLSPERTH